MTQISAIQTRKPHFLFRFSLWGFLMLCGCAARVNTASVPGCATTAIVAVPKECYATEFDGALEIRCNDGSTTRYACKTK